LQRAKDSKNKNYKNKPLQQQKAKTNKQNMKLACLKKPLPKTKETLS
jgi:hypothetical protein